MSKIWVILIYSVVSFCIMFLVAKILGKKQIAELSFIDYVVGISIGSIVANWATDLNTPYEYYLLATAVYFVFSVSITILERKALFLKSFLRGKPLIIVEDGKINYENLKKSKLDINDLLGLCRCKNYFSFEDIEYAIFETNGELSILPKSCKMSPNCQDLNIPKEKSHLQKFIINDGKINKSYLKTINKDEIWLKNKLNIKNKKQLKQIIVAFYDAKTDKFTVHYK